MTKKKQKEAPFGACPYCWTYHNLEDPNHLDSEVEIPEERGDANIIFVGESPEWDSKSGISAIFRQVIKSTGARPVFVKARQCQIDTLIELGEIKRNREVFFLPILQRFPNLPIVAFGGPAAMMVAGGKCSDTSMVNEVYEIHNRICAFTYHPKTYFENEFTFSRDDRIIETMEVAIKAALQPIEKPEYFTNGFPTDVSTIVIDVEATDTKFPWYGTKLIEIGILDSGGKAWTFRPEEITTAQKDFLGQRVHLVVGHNLMYDLVTLSHAGISFPNARFHDTMIYHKNLYPNEWFYGLKPLAKKYHNYPHYDAWFSSLMQGGDIEYASEFRCEYNKICDYNVHDLWATRSLFDAQRREYAPFTLEMDYMKYALKLIQNGMYVDVARLDKMIEETGAELLSLQESVKSEFALGQDFNFNSPPQVLSLLQKEIPDIKGTGVDVISKHAGEHPFVDRLLGIRDLAKLKGTGLEGLKEYIDINSLVHTSLAVHGAETGRSSSSSPNLQNTDPRVRPLFVSRYEAGKLIHTDLAGIEYRLIAHASQDPDLLSVFRQGIDIHSRAYERIFGRPPNDKEERKIGKVCNFLGVYGGGYRKFLVASGLPDCEDSQRAFYTVSGLYPGVERWKKATIRSLYDTRRVRNLFGRVREFLTVSMGDQREAINWIIQSSGHDILKIYCMELFDYLKDYALHRTLLVSEVHDSNTFDSPPEEHTRAHQLISTIAKDLNPLILECFGVKMKIPIVAGVELLDQWA